MGDNGLIILPRKFKDTYKFSEVGKRFLEYGEYIDAPEGTEAWREFWYREKNRIENGHTIGNISITGDHYFYLNFTPMMRRKIEDEKDDLDETFLDGILNPGTDRVLLKKHRHESLLAGCFLLFREIQH